MRGGALEAQRRERDRHLGRPAGGVAPGGDRPHAVPLGVDLLSLVGDQRVGARAVGVELERVAVAAVGEGVEDEGDESSFCPIGESRSISLATIASGFESSARMPK